MDPKSIFHSHSCQLGSYSNLTDLLPDWRDSANDQEHHRYNVFKRLAIGTLGQFLVCGWRNNTDNESMDTEF